ncbi:hypothetical protein TCAL_02796 [Tigriopus californicus]|uniref:Translation factor GUF1 homolog, mitochondrial n=1 Tax=Tigriopus californicus TaxID=6832 RepID=A0A553NZM4_TIGCA|nr:translation factor Guf1, mitochondrial-like [Tigriopus californicus]TRY70881.1 hypothetical protein TCAL_02796 [Tigriopus californicus]
MIFFRRPLFPCHLIQWTLLTRSQSSDVSNKIHHTDLKDVPLERIRNFSIVAHIDHGKSTLADRILEVVGAISISKDNKQILDKLQVERERGITVKAQTASFIYDYQGQDMLLNLIDTPGHVDFSAEVSKSLASCQGVILVVDAKQGVQAQTVSNYNLAVANDLAVVPVLNKIDLPEVDLDSCLNQLESLFDIDPNSVILASAKSGIGIEEILDAVVDRILPPLTHGQGDSLKFLLQDSWYDQYKGAVGLIQVFDGVLKLGDEITSVKTKKTYNVKSLGILTPEEVSVPAIHPGQIGFFTCNMKTTKEAIVGDTFHRINRPVEPILHVSTPNPMVYSGFYPTESSYYSNLKTAIDKISLNDSSVSIDPETSPALGSGWRIGFLGLLHMEVFSQRLQQEFDAEVILTQPSVPYKIIPKPHLVKKFGQEIWVKTPKDWVDKDVAETYLEPIVKGTIIVPEEYMQQVASLCSSCRGIAEDTTFVDQTRVRMVYTLPLSDIVTNFFDDLKRITSGYGSFDYEDAGYIHSQLIKVDILLNGKPVPELSFLSNPSKARPTGKIKVAKLKELLPRQLYDVAIQATRGKTILARETIKAARKDVTAKCYGGDLTRKQKLLKNQAEGKKRLRAIGNIQVSKETFIKVLTNK